MKGIILSGGLGKRLYPATYAVSKQLLSVYNKPIIYYSLSTLMLADIKDILIITTQEDLQNYKKLFGNGSRLGIKIQYLVQKKPKGLVDAFILGSKFIGKDDVCLILGDNIFYGDNFPQLMHQSKKIVREKRKAVLFTFPVKNPSEYGVAVTRKNKLITIKEKPKNSNSRNAIVGLYFYPNSVVEISKKIKPSKRGELEITDLNLLYLKKNNIELIKMGRGYAWFDAGTENSLNEVSQLIKSIESRMGYKIGCIEEIAYDKRWISKKEIKKITKIFYQSDYSKYLASLIE